MNLFLIISDAWSDIADPHVVEFGSFRGGTTVFIATVLRALRPDARLFALDTFSGSPGAFQNLDLHQEGDFSDCSMAALQTRCGELGLNNVTLLQGRIEDTYPRMLAGRHRFGLAHVDCDTYEAVKFALNAVWPDMSPGGYVVLDDADGSSCLGATQAMEEIVVERQIHSEQAWPHFVFRKEDDPEAGSGSHLESVLVSRRQTRRFKREPVPDDLLDDLLDLMHSAPSVGNSKPWRLVRIRTELAHQDLERCFTRADEATRARLAPDQIAAYDRLHLNGFLEAPIQLVIFTDLAPAAGHGQGSTTFPEALKQSTIGAIHTLWLAAVSRGLGFGWSSTFYADDMNRAFGKQDSWAFAAHVVLGWPLTVIDRPCNEACGFQGNTPLQIYEL